uniref:Uncharacterized protein n=1 Tax=Rhizophora mucronata TaxID=61149 RepID=A0A2P2QX42_RHIMU
MLVVQWFFRRTVTGGNNKKILLMCEECLSLSLMYCVTGTDNNNCR